MQRDHVMTNPKQLLKKELINKGFDLDTLQAPKRIYILADSLFDAIIERNVGEYKYPIGGGLFVFKKNSNVGFLKGAMCSPAIATQTEDLSAAGITEYIHVGFAGGIPSNMKIGQVIVTDGAFNDTAVAGLYGYNIDFITSNDELTDEIEKAMTGHRISVLRGKHWTTDAGYHETWGQILDYREKGALCVEMEAVGLFTIAKYRGCKAAGIYIVSDTFDENGWNLGWDENKIRQSVNKLISTIIQIEQSGSF